LEEFAVTGVAKPLPYLPRDPWIVAKKQRNNLTPSRGLKIVLYNNSLFRHNNYYDDEKRN